MAREDHLNHMPDATAINQIKEIRRACIALEELFDDHVPADTAERELIIAKERLEEARMWAIKGVTKSHPADPV